VTDSVLFNGEPGEPALVFHRGFTYGDGVFRTCLIYDSHVTDLEQQIQKVCADAERVHLQPDPERLALEARSLAAGRARGVLKILLLRSGGERGYRSGGQRADRLLCRYAAPAFPAAAWAQGVRLARLDFRLAAQPALAGVKHLNRLEQVLAARGIPADAPEGIVCDDAGEPLSGTRTNLFWLSKDVLRTPALERCGVAGHMRARVLAAAAALALRARVAPGSWAELAGADEVFVTNSLIGLWPVAELGASRWAAPGPVTQRLMAHLRHPRLEAR
jgi:4-amino-4-deoxychorismate lyase